MSFNPSALWPCDNPEAIGQKKVDIEFWRLLQMAVAKK